MMDPQLGMWHTVDPLADKYYSLSPYNYAGDNPVNIVDPNGMDIVNFSGGTTYTGQDARNFFQSTKDVFQDNPETIEGSNKHKNNNGTKQPAESHWYGNDPNASGDATTHNLIVMFSGAQFSGESSETLRGMADELRPYGTVLTFGSEYLRSNNVNTSEFATYIQLYTKQFPGTKVYLYGYSYGGLLVNEIAKRLGTLKIPVQYMAIVDGANGYASNSVNRQVSGNVKFTDNFYQLSRDITGSHGAPYKGINTVHNYLYSASHKDMDEATRNVILNMMRVFLTSN